MKTLPPSPHVAPHTYRLLTVIGLLLTLDPADAQTTPLKVMPLGDSITYGFNGINHPNGSISGGYRKQLGIRLAAAGIRYDFVGNSTLNAAPGSDPDHNGYPGIRTDQALGNLSGWLGVNPDVVLIHLGTNDMIQHVPISTAINNLSSLIDRITAGAPARKVYVATIIPIIDTRDGHTPAEWKVIVDAYNAQVRSLVQQHANLGRKIMLTDMGAGLVYTDPNPANNFFQPGDGTHPARAGYNQMGNFWFNAITAGVTVPPPVTGSQLLTNGSFESDFTGWTRSGNQAIQSAGAYAATDGTRLVVFNAGNSAPNGVISQTFATTAGVSYSLTFDAGVLAYTTSEQRLQVSVNGTGPRLSQVVSLTGPGNGGTRWVRQNFSFTADSATTTLTFRDQSASTHSLDLLLDNVRVTGGGTVAANTAPVAVADSYTTAKNTALVVAANGVLANDTDAQANALTAVLNSGPGKGSLALNSNGSFTYTPAANFTGADSFSYRANDGLLNSNVVTVGISVNAVAATGVLVNGSFESGFTGWTTSGNQSIASAAPYAATAGTKLVSFNAGNTSPNAALSQSFATTAGQNYTLAFDAGVLSYNTSSQTLLVSVSGRAGLLNRSITLNGLGGGSNRWLPQTFTFTADSASATLTFRDQSSSTYALDLLLDNVRVTGPPSPLATPTSVVEVSVVTSPAVATPSPFPTPFPMPTPSLTGEPGNLAIRMDVVSPGTYVLERSTDLIIWEVVEKRIMHGAGPLEFLETLNAATTPARRAAMFYRIGQEPETAAD